MDAADLPKCGVKVPGHEWSSSMADDCFGYSLSEKKVLSHKACKIRCLCVRYSPDLYLFAQVIDGYDDASVLLG